MFNTDTRNNISFSESSDYLNENSNEIEMNYDYLSEDITSETSDNIDYDTLMADSVDSGDAISDQMTLYLKEIANYKVLSSEEVYDLARKAHAGDYDARDKLFLHNLKLVVIVAKPYFKKARSMTELDIIMEGNFGLWKAIDAFDPDKGFKFSTYAYRWIQNRIQRAIMNTDLSIRLPIHIYEKVSKYIRCMEEYKQKTDSENLPPKEYVQENLNLNDWDYDTVVHAYEKMNTDSLNKPISLEIDETTEVIDFIVDEKQSVESVVENQILAELFDELIENFLVRAGAHDDTRDRNRDWLYRRFGLHGYHVHTFEEIGSMYGTSRERVRQIEAQFIKFCRTGRQRHILKQFLD